MENEFLGALAAYMQSFFEDQLNGCEIFFTEESRASFLLYTEAGILGFEVSVYIKDDIPHGADVNTYFMLGEEEVHPFDLCNITFDGYEILNELQFELVWSKLVLLSDEGSKLPRLSRSEVFNAELEEDSLIEQLSEMLGTVRDEGVQILPVIVSLSSGVQLKLKDVPDALLTPVGGIQ